MNKGVRFYFGYDIDKRLRAKLIKEAGFDSVITSYDKKYQKVNGSLRFQAKEIKKYGLRPSSLHFRYETEDLPDFWEEGKKGEKAKKSLIQDVKNAKKYGFTCVVVHLAGTYSSIGEKRLLEVLEICQKINIPLAIENIGEAELFITVHEKISHPMLKVCFDVGHQNVFDKDFDVVDYCDEKIITLHLHNNDGTADQHSLVGNIDWEKLGEKLKNHKDISLDFELKGGLPHLSTEEYLKEVKKLADVLEHYIQNKK